MEYSKAKFKQLALEAVLTMTKNHAKAPSAQEVVSEAKIIEEYLISDTE